MSPFLGPMRKMLPNLVSLLVLGTLFTAPSAVHADLAILTPETLMQAQTADVLVLEAYAGPDFSTSLQSTYTLDTDTGSFSYSQVPGQTYLGQAFSLSGFGTYDPATTTFNWTDSGEFGSAAWSGSGQMQWTGDDPYAFSNISVTIAGVPCLIGGTLNCTPTGPSTGTSTGQMSVCISPGATRTYDVTDKYTPGKWSVIASSGATITWKAGSTTATFTPEPATLLLFGLGGLTVLRKKKAQLRHPI